MIAKVNNTYSAELTIHQFGDLRARVPGDMAVATRSSSRWDRGGAGWVRGPQRLIWDRQEFRVRAGGCTSTSHGPGEALAEEDGELRLGHRPLSWGLWSMLGDEGQAAACS